MSSYQQFFEDVLSGLGLIATRGNLNALASVAILEGANDRYNPLNSVVPSGNSTGFNSVGVQDYKSYANGVAGTVALLQGSPWNGVRSALQAGNEQGVQDAFKNVYQGWDPGVQFNASGGQIAGTLSSSLGSSSGGGGAGGGGGGGTAMSSSLETRGSGLTAAANSLNDGLGKLLTSVPELHTLLNKAVSEGMGTAEFKDAIENTNWWKTNSATTRNFLVLAANDPAEYRKQLSDAERRVTQEADKLGTPLNAYQTASVAHAGLLGGNLTDTGWLDNILAGTVNPNAHKNTNNLSGGLAGTVAQVQQAAADYGMGSSSENYVAAAKNILAGTTTLDTYVNHYKTQAKSAFPGLSSQIDSGLTVKDLAQPYQQAMGNLLEINPSSIGLNDPTVRKALQGTQATTAGHATVPAAQPLWQFEDTVRADPRWALTQNAKDTVSTALTKIGQDWGFQ